jgi:hypothetical protein
LVALLPILAMACGQETEISEEERSEAMQTGYAVGSSWGANWPRDVAVWWVVPDRVEARHRDRPIPELYRRPEDFGGEVSDRVRRELAEAYNWGVYCGFNDGAGRAAHVGLLGQVYTDVYEIRYGE